MLSKEITMPKYEPIPLVTKGMSRWQRIKATYFTPRKHRLTETYVIYDESLDWWYILPKGFVFDGASIPRWLWWLIPPMGVFLIPSLPHDLGYRYGEIITYSYNHGLRHGPCSKDVIDKVFHDLSLQINATEISSWSAWKAVAYFGFAWGKHRKVGLDIRNEFPLDKVTEELAQDLKEGLYAT